MIRRRLAVAHGERVLGVRAIDAQGAGERDLAELEVDELLVERGVVRGLVRLVCAGDGVVVEVDRPERGVLMISAVLEVMETVQNGRDEDAEPVNEQS
jgi:hypothetical protein